MKHLGLHWQLAMRHGALLALCLAAAVQSRAAADTTLPALDAQLLALQANHSALGTATVRARLVSAREPHSTGNAACRCLAQDA